MGYDPQLLRSMETPPDSVFADGGQRLVYSICDIRETDKSYVVTFKPSGDGRGDQITFDFLGNHLFISGECHPEFSIGVQAGPRPIEARFCAGALEIILPKLSCKQLSRSKRRRPSSWRCLSGF